MSIPRQPPSDEIAHRLLAHWPLDQNGRELVRGLDAQPYNLQFDSGGAAFDGRGWLEVPHHPSIKLGVRAWTLSAWINVPADLPDVVGDIVSKFDPAARTGMNLTVLDHGGATSGQANYRQIQFGIDAQTEPHCTDCGRPGDASMVFALAAHAGQLYAATFEHGENRVGCVYRYGGGTQWENCGIPTRANAVAGLASLNGRLYACAGCYDARGSDLRGRGNEWAESKLFGLEPDGRWTDCGALPGEPDLHCLGIYRGRLYAAPSYTPGLYRYEGEQRWITCAAPAPRFFALGQWRGGLHAAANRSLRELGPPPDYARRFIALPDSDAVYRYDDQADAWRGCGKLGEETQMYALAVHDAALHVATWPTAKVFRTSDGIEWQDLGRIHPDEKEVMAMNVYNGKLYVGSLPGGAVYRHDGDQRWTLIAHLDRTPDVKYRRVWSMAVHDGRLFAGTLPSGHVFAIETGSAVSDSRQLAAGWQHVVAVHDGHRLALYVNGLPAAESSRKGAVLDLSNREPLRIGAGSHDRFHGRIADVRLHGCALTPAAIERLCRESNRNGAG